jgi:uncharacterized membrane protein
MTYLTLKYIHLLSMVLLFGTGLGSAFYKWMADRSRNVIHISIVNRHVVLADWLFTTPTVLIQPITGIWMLYLIHIPLTTSWVVISLALYALAGLCWIPVVWLQIRMQKLAQLAVEQKTDLDSQYWRYARIWFYLGIPAFTAMVFIVLLMVMKFSFGV